MKTSNVQSTLPSTFVTLTLAIGWLLVPWLYDLATVTWPAESLRQCRTSSSPYIKKIIHKVRFKKKNELL